MTLVPNKTGLAHDPNSGIDRQYIKGQSIPSTGEGKNEKPIWDVPESAYQQIDDYVERR